MWIQQIKVEKNLHNALYFICQINVTNNGLHQTSKTVNVDTFINSHQK